MFEIETTDCAPKSKLGRTIFNSDSMQPTIKKGDVIEVDLSIQKYSGDGIYCFTWSDSFGDAIILRRVIRQMDGTYRAINDNESYTSQNLTEIELKSWPITGRVIRSFSESNH